MYYEAKVDVVERSTYIYTLISLSLIQREKVKFFDNKKLNS